jgi:hypothetical protein
VKLEKKKFKDENKFSIKKLEAKIADMLEFL